MVFTQSNPINCCIFTGRLKEFSVMSVGEGGRYTIGKGILSLPDPEMPNVGQPIKLICWEGLAERLSEVKLGSWVKVVSSYSPSEFRGKIQDQFTVTSFVEIDNE